MLQFFIDFRAFWEGFGRVWGGFGEGLGGFGEGLGRVWGSFWLDFGFQDVYRGYYKATGQRGWAGGLRSALKLRELEDL